MGVTAIKQINNNFTEPIFVHNHENPSNSITVAPNTSATFEIWIPWCTSTSDWQWNRYLTLERVDHSVLYWVWQQDNDVRYGTDGQFHNQGTPIPGFSTVNGDRLLTINHDSTILLTQGLVQLGDYRACAGIAASVLIVWYTNSGLWNGIGWWNSANTLEALIDYALLTNSTGYNQIIANTFDQNRLPSAYNGNTVGYTGNFINNYYDDEGWWALTWLKAYDLTNDGRYLAMAKTIFADMQTGWYPNTYGGGLRWRKKDDNLKSPTFGQDDYGKGAIANELFLTAAARLYQRTSDQQYLVWASKTWAWFLYIGMIGTQAAHNENANVMVNLVNEGLTMKDGKPWFNSNPIWTYTQGVILGGLVDLYKITGDISLINQAHIIAEAVINPNTIIDPNNANLHLVNTDGILQEVFLQPGNPDQPQFKGIFMRSLAYLYAADPSKVEYKTFILKNAASIWLKNRTSDNKLGLHWAGPVDNPDASRHSSALGALNAALPFAWTASCKSQSIPNSMTAGQSYAATVTMVNTGATTWTAGGSNPPVRLGTQAPQDNATWGLSRVDVPFAVAPGATVTFSFTVRAPATPGNYTFQWRMVEETVTWFGDFTPALQIAVQAKSGKEGKEQKEGKERKELKENMIEKTRDNAINDPVRLHTQTDTETGLDSPTKQAFIEPNERPSIGQEPAS